MSKHEYPLTCCDSDCAGANGCREGGYQCEDCGMWFCPDTSGSDTPNLCADCAARRREEQEAEEEQEAKDGE